MAGTASAYSMASSRSSRRGLDRLIGYMPRTLPARQCRPTCREGLELRTQVPGDNGRTRRAAHQRLTYALRRDNYAVISMRVRQVQHGTNSRCGAVQVTAEETDQG